MSLQNRTRRTKRRIPKTVICIGGMTGSGKSSVARRLAAEYGLQYFSGGDALKALATEIGYKVAGKGWWEGKEGMRFLQQRTKEDKFDKEVDRRLLELAKQGYVILDSWTMPWLLKDKSFKIWLEASVPMRAERVAERDGVGLVTALATLKEKDEKTRAIYKKLYGFELGIDFSPFDLVLDSSNLSADEVFRILSLVLKRFLFGID
ncbi:MAG: cytidylate kinase family protein [Candidatus Bathyarchaeota archaeon]|nr:MAG: cytidylate kinase family protein [Candidatus Bathyarchaeota archaeon]